MKIKKYMDGHTGINFPSFFSDSGKNLQYFPQVRLPDNQILLNEDTLCSINGIPAPEIFKELDLLVSWEAHPKNRQKKMNEYLSPLLHHVYKISSPFKCVLRKKGSENNTDSIIASVDYQTWNRAYNHLSAKRYTESYLSYDYFPKDSIALLYYNNSNISGNDALKNQFDRFAEVFFQQVEQQGIKYLFIDVSQNKGGSDLAHQSFYHYLRTDSYKVHMNVVAKKEGALKLYDDYYETTMKAVGKEKGSKLSRKAFEKKDPWVKNMISPLIKKGKIDRRYKNPSKNTGFKGKVFIIMGENTYSAGYDFCETSKRGNIGLLVGEEPGQRSPFCGNQISDRLPASGIAFYYPTTYDWTEPVLPNKEGFLLPDIPYPLDRLLDIDDYKKIIEISRERNL